MEMENEGTLKKSQLMDQFSVSQPRTHVFAITFPNCSFSLVFETPDSNTVNRF